MFFNTEPSADRDNVDDFVSRMERMLRSVKFNASDSSYSVNVVSPDAQNITEHYFGICMSLKLYNGTNTRLASFAHTNVFNFTTLISEYATMNFLARVISFVT